MCARRSTAPSPTAWSIPATSIQAGQRLGNVVPLNEVFIDANFKETQLKRIRPGQPVTI